METPPPLPDDPRDRLPPLLRRYCPHPDTVRQQTRLWADKALSLLYGWLTRFGNACARNWTVLDRTGRLFVACLGVLSLCCTLLAIAGWSRKPGDETPNPSTLSAASDKGTPPKLEWHPDYTDRDKQWKTDYSKRDKPAVDPRIAAAYEIHQRFVLNSVFFRYGGMTGYWIQPVPGYSCIADNFRFLPVTQTRIARNGNYYRIRGRITFDIEGHMQGEPPSKDQWVEYACQMDHDPDLDVWRLRGKVEEIASNIPGRVP